MDRLYSGKGSWHHFYMTLMFLTFFSHFGLLHRLTKNNVGVSYRGVGGALWPKCACFRASLQTQVSCILKWQLWFSGCFWIFMSFRYGNLVVLKSMIWLKRTKYHWWCQQPIKQAKHLKVWEVCPLRIYYF